MHFIFKPQTSCLPWEPTLSVALRRCCTGSWLLNPSVTPEASVSVAQASDKGSSTFHSGWRICLSRGSSMHPACSAWVCTRSASHGPSAHTQGLGTQSLLPLLHASISGQDLKHNQVRAMTCPAATAGRYFPGSSDIGCDTPGCDRNPWKEASRRSADGSAAQSSPGAALLSTLHTVFSI